MLKTQRQGPQSVPVSNIRRFPSIEVGTGRALSSQKMAAAVEATPAPAPAAEAPAVAGTASAASATPLKPGAKTDSPTSVYDFVATELGTGKLVDLAEYRGRVLLIVNTASKCGFTWQYGPLEEVRCAAVSLWPHAPSACPRCRVGTWQRLFCVRPQHRPRSRFFFLPPPCAAALPKVQGPRVRAVGRKSCGGSPQRFAGRASRTLTTNGATGKP